MGWISCTSTRSRKVFCSGEKKEPRIQFRRDTVGCGSMNLFNRESPRINANRIFLAFGCSAPAYRLRRNRTLSGKMLGKNPPAGFSHTRILSFFFFLIGVRGSDCGVDAESGNPQLSKSLICDPARSGPRWNILFAETPYVSM